MEVKRHSLGPLTLLAGDVRAALKTLPDNHFHCCVTSPPYWALRSYLKKGDPLKALELGSEATPEEYIANQVAVFREVRRVLRDDGLCWVDIGDSYAGGGKGGNPAESIYRKQATNAGSLVAPTPVPPGLKPGDLCLIPQRLALALQADGWYVRQIAIWAKPAPMPESIAGTRWERHKIKVAPCSAPNTGGIRGVNLLESRGGWSQETHPETRTRAKYVDCPGCPKCAPHGGYVLRRGSWRCTTAHEFILQLAKSPRYFADQEAVKEIASDNTHSRGKAGTGPDSAEIGYKCAEFGEGIRSNRDFQRYMADQPGAARNPRSVWTIGPEPLAEPHYAAYPSALPEKCINASTSAKGCCPACGAQWARVVELTRSRESGSGRSGNAPSGKNGEGLQGGGATGDVRNGPCVESRTIGWRPSCGCAAESEISNLKSESTRAVPARVLDPYGGSGTTGLQALRMGRECTLIELSPQYVEIIKRRVRDEFGLWVGPTATTCEK